MITTRPFATRSLPLAVLTLLFALCALPFAAYAQSATATLGGTVEDTNGALIPGCAITVTNTATAMQRRTVTSDSGQFTVPLLPPGTYTVRAERDGFAPVETRDVVLNVGDQKALKIELKAGDVNATVQVINEALLVNTSPAVTNTINRTFVGNLPLNGRSFQSLILLTPGVTAAGSSFGSDIGQFSVNGQRASSNTFSVDGVSANISATTSGGPDKDLSLAGSYAGLSAFGGTNNLVSVDALEEFKVHTSTYSAEFGRQPGAQVSLVTRAGQNDFRGSVFEYLRNDALDARNYFNQKPNPQTPLRQNQFGGVFGGPIIKNRTFFFFSYEGQRLRVPTIGNTNVPSLRLRQLASSSVVPLLNGFPIPTGPELLNGAGQPIGFAPWNFSLSLPSTLDATSLRIDHGLGKRHALFGRFNLSPSDTTSVFRTIQTVNSSRTKSITLGLTSILRPALTNEFRFNYSTQRQRQDRSSVISAGASPVDEGLLTNGLGGIGFATFQFSGQIAQVIKGTFADSEQRQFNIVNNVSLAKGGHQLKFGFDFRRLNPIYSPQSSQSITFTSSTAVINGTVNRLSIFNVDTARLRFNNLSVYGQDTWGVSRRLTVSLGLRWELNPAPTEADGKVPPVVTGISNTDVTQAVLAPKGTPFYKTFYGALAPRFGFAYAFGDTNRRTVLRGGLGVYYDLGSAGATSGYPLGGRKTLTNVAFPISVANAARPPVTIPTSVPVTTLVHATNEQLKLPYTLHWNLALEHSFGTNQAVSLSYVAAAGRRLLVSYDLNEVGAAGTIPNPNFSTILFVTNGPTSDYHSFQAQYKGRLKKGLQFLVNYTWSHAIDQVSSDIDQAILEKGNADFDVRHNLSAALSYDFPPARANKFIEAISRNWSVNGILHVQSGRPVDVFNFSGFVRADGTLLLVRPDLVAGIPLYIHDPSLPGGRRFNDAAFVDPPVDANGFPLRQGNFGRNVLRELPIYQLDASVGRTFNLSEQFKLKLSAEGFNILNHPMFGSYDNFFFAGSTTFGVPQTTLNEGLVGLNPLYQLGGPRSIQLSLRLSF